MNIFWLDTDIDKSVQYLCDKHVVKMTLETAQLLCNAFDDPPYKKTHYNHPCSKWVRYSLENFVTACVYGLAISKEYTHRYNKKHKSETVINWCIDNTKNAKFETLSQLSLPPLCMPNKFIIPCKKMSDVVKAYRSYYASKQTKFKMVWTKRPKPKFLIT